MQKHIYFFRKQVHTGYIGSSNLSRSALTNGLEWNIENYTRSKSYHDKFKKTFDTY